MDNWQKERSAAIQNGKFERATLADLANRAANFSKEMRAKLNRKAKVQRSNLQKKLTLIEEGDDLEFWESFERKISQRLSPEIRKIIKAYWKAKR